MKIIVYLSSIFLIVNFVFSLSVNSEFYELEKQVSYLRNTLSEYKDSNLISIKEQFNKVYPNWENTVSGVTLYSFGAEIRGITKEAREYMSKGHTLFLKYHELMKSGKSSFDNYEFEKSGEFYSKAYILTSGLNFRQDSLYELSRCFFYLKDYETMIRVLHYYRSTLENPMLYTDTNEGLEDFARIKSKLAEFAIIDKNFEKAQLLLKESLELREKSLNALYNSACLYNVLGKKEQALWFLSRIFYYYPDYSEDFSGDSDLKGLIPDKLIIEKMKNGYFDFSQKYETKLIDNVQIQKRTITPPIDKDKKPEEKIVRINTLLSNRQLRSTEGRIIPDKAVIEFEQNLQRIINKTKEVFIETEDMAVCPSGSIKVFMSQGDKDSSMITLMITLKDKSKILFLSQSSFLDHIPWNMVYQNRLYSVWDRSFGNSLSNFVYYCGVNIKKLEISDKIFEGIVHKTMVFGPSTINLNEDDGLNEFFNNAEKGEGEALHVLDSIKNIPFLAKKAQENKISLKPLFRVLNSDIPTYNFDVGVVMDDYILEVALVKKGESLSYSDFTPESSKEICEKLLKKRVVLRFLKGRTPDSVLISYPHVQSELERMFFVQTLYTALYSHFPMKIFHQIPQKVEFSVTSGEKRMILVYIPEFDLIFGKFSVFDEKEKIVSQIKDYFVSSGVSDEVATRLDDYFVEAETLSPYTLIIRTNNDSYCERVVKQLQENKIISKREGKEIWIQVFVNPMILPDDEIVLGLKNE